MVVLYTYLFFSFISVPTMYIISRDELEENKQKGKSSKFAIKLDGI